MGHIAWKKYAFIMISLMFAALITAYQTPTTIFSTLEFPPEPVDWWLDVYVYTIIGNGSVENQISPIVAAVNATVYVTGFNNTGEYVFEGYYNGETYTIPLGVGIANAVYENGTLKAKAHIEFTYPRPPTHYKFPVLVTALVNATFLLRNGTEQYLVRWKWNSLLHTVYYDDVGYTIDGYNDTLDYIQRINAIELEWWNRTETGFPDYDETLRELAQEYNLTFIVDEHTVNIYAVLPGNYTKLQNSVHFSAINGSSVQASETSTSTPLSEEHYCDWWETYEVVYWSRRFEIALVGSAMGARYHDAYSKVAPVHVVVGSGSTYGVSSMIGVSVGYDPISLIGKVTGHYVFRIGGNLHFRGDASGLDSENWVVLYGWYQVIVEKVKYDMVEPVLPDEGLYYCTGEYVYVVERYLDPYQVGLLGPSCDTGYRPPSSGWGSYEETGYRYRIGPDRPEGEGPYIAGPSETSSETSFNLIFTVEVAGTHFRTPLLGLGVSLGWSRSSSITHYGYWHDSQETVNKTVWMVGWIGSSLVYLRHYSTSQYPANCIVPERIVVENPTPWFICVWDIEG